MQRLHDFRRRRLAIAALREATTDLDDRVHAASDYGGSPIAFKKEQVQFAFWKEHVDLVRVVLAANQPYLKINQYREMSDALNGHVRLATMIEDRGRIPIAETFYDQYLAKASELAWLGYKQVESST